VRGSRLGSRITAAVIAAAVLPVTAFGVVLLVTLGGPGLGALVLTGIVGGALLGLAIAGLVVGAVTRPVRQLGDRLDRIRSGQSVEPLPPLADDEVGRLAERQEEMAADLARRNRQVARAVNAITAWSPAEGSEALLARAAADARDALGLTDARIVLGDPHRIEHEERVPGDPHPVRAELRTGRDVAGVLAGHAPATARWEPADQDLLELYAASLAVALRDAALLAQVEAQNERLVEIDAEKDDFLRGVSHNLQTPLARIRANADQLAGEQAATGSDVDRRLAIIAEQSERLSRMVRQLLTVSRLDAGALRPVAEVFALGPRVRRAWEALGAGAGPSAGSGVGTGGVPFELVDEAGGWLAVADPDHVDQVIWALLDNAVKHGGGAPVAARVQVDAAAGQVRLTVDDGGPGVAPADRERLFARYARGGTSGARDGTGLGLYVGRALARANRGELALAGGAEFVLGLPAERAEEG
jgi:two-component system sensor histidine kinase KdpD